jgi:deazaflavin-dependent oxidoreductase (nitroreductase family)
MRVLMPLPDRDFDTTEVAVPWRILTDRGHTVTFATEHGGSTPACDPLLLSGVLFGKLGARADAVEAYRQLVASPEFTSPQSWQEIDVTAFDGLLLPGGHAPGMRQYLGSAELQGQVASFWATGRPVGAICHGVLVLARTVDPSTGASVIAERRTTCLPKYMETSAYVLTAWRLGRYYRTHPEYVQDEVVGALHSPSQFERGPRETTKRGTATDDSHAFAVRDGNYVSARWPGDAYLFANRFHELLTEEGCDMTESPFPDARWGSQDSILVRPFSAFAATKPGSWLVRTMTPLDRRILTRTGGRFTVLGPVGAPTMLLTTTGAKSGLPRTSPLLFCRDGQRLMVIGSNFGQAKHPAWTGNLRANPEATVTIGGKDTPVVAHQLEGDERQRAIESFIDLTRVYAEYLSCTDREIRVFALEAKP